MSSNVTLPAAQQQHRVSTLGQCGCPTNYMVTSKSCQFEFGCEKSFKELSGPVFCLYPLVYPASHVPITNPIINFLFSKIQESRILQPGGNILSEQSSWKFDQQSFKTSNILQGKYISHVGRGPEVFFCLIPRLFDC